MTKAYSRFLTALFCLFLGGLMVWQVLLPDRERSDVENRTLAQWPEFSWESLKDGSYTAAVEEYFADQFPLRDAWTGLKARTEQLIGKTEFHGVYLCGDTLISKVDTPDEELVTNNLSYITRLAEKTDVPVYLGFIPSAAEVWRDKLPAGAESWDQTAFLDRAAEETGLPTVDFAGALTAHADEPIFYRTDHHWNYLGSYRAYRELLPLLGCTDTPLEPTATETLGEFSGSKAAGTGLDIFSEPFTVYRFAYPEMTVTRNGEPAGDYGRQDAVPGELALSYGAFYGGDDGEIIFDTGRTDRGNLLVIGESYDNAILKLLASHFDRTYSVDLRYYRNYMGSDFSLSDYLRRNNITKVLLIGNVDYYISPDFALEN